MSTTTIVIAIAVAFLIFAIIKKQTAQQREPETAERPRRKHPLSKNEAAMYNRLTQSLPEMVVLAQVSFGALLTARSKSTRNRFDRKIADFVICDKAMQVRAIIELDDSSHRGKESRDAERDRMLEEAGYRVVRYARIPDIEQVRADFAPPKHPIDAEKAPLELTD